VATRATSWLYSGASGELTLRTRWQDHEEHPVIVHIEPVI